MAEQPNQQRAVNEYPEEKRPDGTVIRKTTCFMCACRCGIRVHLRDDQIRYIDGNPDHPLNGGVICAKGASGIMKQYSPARLTKPLRRRANAERGDAAFEAITWDEALETLGERLQGIRETAPEKFALFTGRDQMQTLTRLFAKQYGTPNYATHGGLCSVNMAAGMIYSIGGSFWEFGGPDLERARLFVMIGTAEDHHSNPLKIAISKFKRRGGRFISINPVRTGYSAIADQWIPIKPGTDGALLLALIYEIIQSDLVDEAFVARYSNGGQLVNCGDGEHAGLFARAEGSEPDWGKESPHKLWWDETTDNIVTTHSSQTHPRIRGATTLPDGTKVKPAFELLCEQVDGCTAEWAAEHTGIPAATIRALALELGTAARDHKIDLPLAWTDVWGVQHDRITGSPVSFHAMRGLAAHSNGFQTIRALSILMILLGTIDVPGGFRHKAPFPRPIPPFPKTPNCAGGVNAGEPLVGEPLGFPAGPDDLFVDDSGEPLRLDKAFSWEHPLSLHGMMQNVITNAWRGNPYPIDTLMIFMANMAWNSTMNTMEVRRYLNDKDENGDYKIPFIVVCDAFQSEMVAFADLVLPDTTYLERHDVMSMLDRPISEFDGPVDSVRVPVMPPTGECRPFQDVLIELAGRLNLPGFVNENGEPKFLNYPDFVSRFEATPGQGLLMGYRGQDSQQAILGVPNANQWQKYAENNCVFHHRLPEAQQFMRNFNKDYLEWAERSKLGVTTAPILCNIYSEILQTFRMAGEARWPGRTPPPRLRQRVVDYFDPLPFWYPPLESNAVDTDEYPLNAITQRPMAMYHSWDSQNAWLRQIHTHNHLFLNPHTAEHFSTPTASINDGDWIWVESPWGKVKCMCRFSNAVEPGTVWTWNAIGKAPGAWGLSPDANEANKGFLLNHLVTEELPLKRSAAADPNGDDDAPRISNSDPVTGQAGWYDVRVKIYPAEKRQVAQTWPTLTPMPEVPGQTSARRRGLLAYFRGSLTGDRS